MGFGVGLIVSDLFELDGVARGVIIIECSMPAAGFHALSFSPQASGCADATALLAAVVCHSWRWWCTGPECPYFCACAGWVGCFVLVLQGVAAPFD